MLQREPTTNIADREDVSQAADLIERAFETIMMLDRILPKRSSVTLRLTTSESDVTWLVVRVVAYQCQSRDHC
jgi:hypothetical protein